MNQPIQDKLSAFIVEAFAPFGAKPDIGFKKERGILKIEISLDPRAAEIMLKSVDIVLAWQQIIRAAAVSFTLDKVVVDINNFLSVQNTELRELVENAARKVKQSGKPLKLSPMTAFERRIAHLVISEDYPELSTESVGNPPRRCVIIKLKE